MESCKEKQDWKVVALYCLIFFYGKISTPNPFETPEFKIKEVFQSFPGSMEDEILTAVGVDWSIWRE